jgi:phospholipid/cholesterol/gamma-HCH transport system substrate-binding protein
MESDKRYFIEGLFVIGFSVALAFFFLWLVRSGNKDDVHYRINFAESVSGLALGDPVKFMGVDAGMVKDMAIDKADPNKVQVDIALLKDTPVRTDTTATLKLKGITGASFIELNGGGADAKSLVATTPVGKTPEIPAVKSSLNAALDNLPKVVAKFSAIEDQTKKVVTDMGAVTKEVKAKPSLLLWGRPKKDGNKDNSRRSDKKK